MIYFIFNHCSIPTVISLTELSNRLLRIYVAGNVCLGNREFDIVCLPNCTFNAYNTSFAILIKSASYCKILNSGSKNIYIRRAKKKEFLK